MRRAHVPNATLSFWELLVASVRPLAITEAEETVAELLNVPHAVLFASARGALATTVKAITSGGQVALPAYTCAAVANAVLTAGAIPLYVDVDEKGLVRPSAWPETADLAIAQDTYGFAAALPEGTPVIRDAAHRVDLVTRPGSRVAITSFEHSKWLSAGEGGLAVTADKRLAAQLRELRDTCSAPQSRLAHVLFTLVAMTMGRLDYRGWIRAGRFARRIAHHLSEDRLVGQDRGELQGSGVAERLRGRPNESVARLVVNQLRRADAVSKHRRRIVQVYDAAAGIDRTAEPLVRYPLKADDPESVEAALSSGGWDIRGGWFRSALHPGGDEVEAYGYERGSAPIAERLAKRIVNLPTHPLVTEKDAADLAVLVIRAGARPLV